MGEKNHIRDNPRDAASQPFVGREREMAELRAGLDSAIAGRGRLFLISGEPGIGKSRLAEEVSTEAAQRGMRVLWGRCWEGGGAPTYWPIIQVLRGCAERPDFAQLAESLGSSVAPVAALVPEILRLALSLGELTPSERIDPEQGRFRLFDAVTNLLKSLASLEPMLVVIDDLHDADGSTLQMLRFLARGLKNAPILLIGIHREAEVERSPELRSGIAALAREGSQLPLIGLTRIDTAAFLRASTGIAADEHLLATLYLATNGNPLFLSGVTQTLFAEGKLESQARLTVSDLKLPATVRGSIKVRLGAMSSKSVAIISVAAALGNEFELELLQRLAGLPHHEILESLDEAAALGLIHQISNSAGRYCFDHALIREVIYDAIGTAERVNLHHQIAQGIEHVYAGEIGSHLQELAHHCVEAIPYGTVEKAIDYSTRAGDAAYSVFAFDEALAHWKTALRLADRSGASPLCRAGLLRRLGDDLLPIAGPEAISYLEAAVPLYEDAGDRESVAQIETWLGLLFSGPETGARNPERAAAYLRKAESYFAELPDSKEAAFFYTIKSDTCWWLQDIDQGIAAARQAMEISERLRNLFTWASAAALLGMLLVERGSLAEGLQLFDLARNRSESIDNPQLSTVAWCGGGMYEALWDPLEAQRWYARELALTRTNGSPKRAPILHNRIAVVLQMVGDLEGAQRHRAEAAAAAWPQFDDKVISEKSLTESFDQARVTGDRYNQILSSLWLGSMFQDRGDYPRALEYYEHILSVAMPQGAVLWELRARPEVARIKVTTGALAEARSNLDRCQEILAAGENWRGLVGNVARAEAVLAAALERLDESNQRFECAIDVFRRYSLARAEAETLRLWGRALGNAGERVKADEKLDSAIEIYQRIGAGQASIDRTLAEKARATDVSKASASATENVFCREGDFWTITYGDKTFRLRNLKGLEYIAYLLAHPGVRIHARDLMAVVEGRSHHDPGASKGVAHAEGLATTSDLGDAGEVLDAHAVSSYRQRLIELRAELAEAESNNDLGAMERARREFEELRSQLAAGVGRSGRARRSSSHLERVRAAVTKNIRAGVERIRRNDAKLGEHFAASIRTGAFCAYLPDLKGNLPWRT